MSDIKILPEVLSNKIAAGEVVQRPASVVKELLENALDARATRIMIEIERGGRSLIQVSDNGTGMNRDDALLSLERYATSKIYGDHDLFTIHTLGFRGEALPSIASVSRFILVTCKKDTDTGTRIMMTGGKIEKVSDFGAPRGTMVTVKQLFFNTPARRKFLKSVITEMGHITDTVSRIALGWPRTQFKLIHNQKLVKLWTAAKNPQDRAVDILGVKFINRLYPMELTHNRIHIAGWAASSQMTRTTSRGIYLYVNGRFVRDRMIRHAIFKGYAGRLMKGQFPLAILFITLPFEMVDVNVHPTKDGVRFADPKSVHEVVTQAVFQALKDKEQPIWAPPSSSPRQMFDGKSTIREPILPYHSKKEVKKEGLKNSGRESTPPVYQPRVTQSDPFPDPEAVMEGHSPPDQSMFPAKNNGFHIHGERNDKSFGQLKIIGQFRNTYILCEAESEMVMIDQHAAHERILYEQLKKQSASETISAQRLLTPETIELGYREAGVLGKMISQLAELGLEIEPFGGNTFIIKAIPTLISDRNIHALITELVEQKIETGTSPEFETALNEHLAVVACHGVIRANQHLSEAEMKALLAQLDGCENPSNCPHGRPTWIRWSIRSLEKLFHRIP